MPDRNRSGLSLWRVASQDRIKPPKNSLGSRNDFLAPVYVFGHGFPLLPHFLAQ
jgi:hypothetical protein